jgi:MarR family transcriptional regulator, organic hydroperoxide resistance regulator
MPSHPDLRLDRQICFALYNASRAVTQAYLPLLAPLGLTYPQYLVMLLLWEEDGASVKELGQRLSLDSGTLTPLLKRVEAAGLLVRRRDRADERVVRVHLTAKGRALEAKAAAVPAAISCRLGTTRAEMARLRDELARLSSTLREGG